MKRERNKETKTEEKKKQHFLLINMFFIKKM